MASPGLADVGGDDLLPHRPSQMIAAERLTLGGQEPASNSKSGKRPGPKPSRKVLRRLEQIESLPRRKQDALLTTIDAFLSSTAS